MEIQMNIAEIKAAVDAGKSVHWANEGYRVHRDGLGQSSSPLSETVAPSV